MTIQVMERFPGRGDEFCEVICYDPDCNIPNPNPFHIESAKFLPRVLLESTNLPSLALGFKVARVHDIQFKKSHKIIIYPLKLFHVVDMYGW